MDGIRQKETNLDESRDRDFDGKLKKLTLGYFVYVRKDGTVNPRRPALVPWSSDLWVLFS
jgi:hypothetical protein